MVGKTLEKECCPLCKYTAIYARINLNADVSAQNTRSVRKQKKKTYLCQTKPPGMRHQHLFWNTQLTLLSTHTQSLHEKGGFLSIVRTRNGIVPFAAASLLLTNVNLSSWVMINFGIRLPELSSA
jgi:hypothetical protein